MKLYEFDTYQDAIRGFIEEQKLLGTPVTYQEISNDLRIQKSYLSKVMAGNASLNKDQAFLLARKLKLNEEEEEYLLMLVERERAGIKEYRKLLDRKIREIRIQKTQTTSYLNKRRHKASSAAQQMYYLYPEIQLIHLAFSIEKYQLDPEKLKEDLNVERVLFEKAIKTLEELGLVEVGNKRVKLIKSDLHLPPDSPLFHQWKAQFKLKSIEWSKTLPANEKYNFLASFTAGEEDKEKIRMEFMKFLKKAEDIVKSSKSERLYQINFDLFKWL